MNDATPMTEASADVIPQELAIRAMRDSGYRNTAYAVAELVDNSVEAEARRVDIVCVERQITLESRATWRITELAVCDDGSGMDAVMLRQALQFGNGTRLTSRSGIGRFGMGLPNSSISQAGRVDVWTWRNGPSNAMQSYLDVEEISRRALREVPKPTSSEVPNEWRSYMRELGQSGTLVVWSQLDPSRLTSKKASKALENIEREIGRVHRKFIADGNLEIRLVRVRDGAIAEERLAHVNDPLYLTPAPHLPDPFDKTPMFEKALEDEPIEITVNGVAHTVWTRYSVARPETNDHVGTAKDRGKTVYGKDAERNAGVSVIRAGRELMLDRSWTNRHDTRERWWGCEVEFPPALDEIFGVTNTKQDATFFRTLAEMEWEDLAEDGETLDQTKERLEAEGDPRGVLLHLST
ncbi:MAG: ATP-binding protein, partial [Parvularcula sp.]|nr:ATP-binding protein [Parvularcula sp.]